jgi:hypothetical protein
MKTFVSRTGAQVGLWIVCALLAGCTPPRAAFRHTLFPGLERYNETQVRAALDTPIVLPRDPRASVLWLDQAPNWGTQPLPDSERERLLDELRRGLTGPPFASVSIIPTAVATGDGDQLDLDDVRSAAAHLQSDVAILVVTSTEAVTEWNALAISYPALLTRLVVPGDDVRVGVAVQGCAIDVRTGLLLDCVQSHAEEVDRFVVPAWRSAAVRSATATATERALSDVPQRLRDGLALRLSSAAARGAGIAGAAAVPTGMRYATSATGR